MMPTQKESSRYLSCESEYESAARLIDEAASPSSPPLQSPSRWMTVGLP